jgi:hypothetical protein
MKPFLLIAAIAAALAACDKPADVASRNLSTAADNFEVARRVTFINGITGDTMLYIEGMCSLGNFDSDRQLSVTCKTGTNAYKKNFLGLSDNVTYIAEQIDGVDVSTFHYRVMLRPQSLLPDVDFQSSGAEMRINRN